MQKSIKIFSIVTILLAGAAGYFGYQTYLQTHAIQSLTGGLASTRADLASTTAELGRVYGELGNTRIERDGFELSYRAEKKRLDDLSFQVQNIGSMVGVLEKLQKTDPELIAKYSKIYFFNENYVPDKLALLDPQYVFKPERGLRIQSDTKQYLERLLTDAARAGVDLQIISAYRSFGEQAGLKQAYSVTYGTGANKFSADQGYSEHQLGTTVDFTTKALGAGFASFEGTPAYTWLLAHAHEYGFVLSYPKNNSYYVFEPWHWRFVSRSLAGKLHEEDKNFYDLDQRVLDTYLVSFFD